MKPIEQLDALREFLSHHLTLRGLEEFESYLEHFTKLETREASARAIMQKFVGKVDTGIARGTETYRTRSKETYREMKAWLEE